MAFSEAVEKMGQIIRWTEQPKNADDKSIYLGPVIQGFYVGLKTKVGQNESNLYEIQLSNGELISVWGSGVIDGKFQEIPQGCEVRITFLGIQEPKKPGGRRYQNFKVEFDASSKAPMKAAGTAAIGAAPVAQASVQQPARPAAAPAAASQDFGDGF